MIERRILIIGESEIADGMNVRGAMSRKAIKRCSERGLYTLLPPPWSHDLMGFCDENYVFSVLKNDMICLRYGDNIILARLPI